MRCHVYIPGATLEEIERGAYQLGWSRAELLRLGAQIAAAYLQDGSDGLAPYLTHLDTARRLRNEQRQLNTQLFDPPGTASIPAEPANGASANAGTTKGA